MTEIEENELICEKLLGWRRHPDPKLHGWWAPPDDGCFISSSIDKRFPTFTTWADAGLIVDALYSRSVHLQIDLYVTGRWRARVAPWFTSLGSEHESGPLAIRAAALEYIRSPK